MEVEEGCVRTRFTAIALLLLVSLASCDEGERALSRVQRPNGKPDGQGGQRERTRVTEKKRPKRRPPINKAKKSLRPSKERRKTSRGPRAYVARVIDGDTIEVILQGVETDLRLIGFDTPETVHPSEPVECFGRAASDYTRNALEGRTVTLEFDVEKTDRYERTLAYVWTDGSLFNETILREGFAAVSTYPPNVRYVERFLDAQRSARNDERGLWRRCGGVDTPAVAPEPQKISSGGGGSCDPNYGGACVPSYPPDLDCPEVPATNFTSRGNDPHGFDGDGDGVACEG
jgi:micrococcal nuclease